MSERKIRGSQWWLPMVAFLAGMGVYAGVLAPRPQVLKAEPSATAPRPSAEATEGTVRFANADTDTCDIQLN